MIRTSLSTILLILILHFDAIARSQDNSVNSPASARQGARSISQMGYHLSHLMALIQDPQFFYSPAQERTIKQHLSGLQKQAHSLSFERPSTSVNPVYRFVFPHLDQDLAMVEQLFQSGEKALARHLLEKTSRVCLDCHTRRKDSQHQIFSHQPAGLPAWSNLKKAQFYAGMWNFAEAIRYYEYALSNRQFSQQSAEWQASIKQLISITIRYQRSPSLALEMSRVFIHHKSAPPHLVAILNAWSQAANEWRQETSFPRTRQAKLAKLQELFRLGQAKDQKQADTGTIEILRAHTLALSLLEETQFDHIYGQSLYWAAIMNEYSKDTNLWTAESSLYEACIRYQAHSELARLCWPKVEKEYQEMAKLSRSGVLPQGLQLRLRRLFELALAKRN